MVERDVVRSLNTSVVQSRPLVAVFFGGTGGIGSYTIRSLSTAEAQNGGKGLRAYIVGRNIKAAEQFIAECRSLYAKGDFKFIQAGDMSLIKEIDRLCAELLEAEEAYGGDGRIDYLMMGQGAMPYQPRKDTAEGLDFTMSLMYYSRMRIVTKLLPLLLKPSSSPPTVVSVFAAGAENHLFPEDLSLRHVSPFKYDHSRSHMCYMHCLFFEALSVQHPGKMSLIHIFPGLVPGPGFHSKELPLWFRVLFHGVVLPLFGRWITLKPDESGERMVSLASLSCYPPSPSSIESAKTGSGASGATQPSAITGTDGQPGSGVYSLKWNGESSYPTKKYAVFDKDAMREKVYNHTVRAFEVIEQGGVFAE